MRDRNDEENASTLPITVKLRKSVLKRQKYLSVLDQLNLLRFLSSLDHSTIKEKEWTEFACKVLESVPQLTIMEMNLRELQSFTVNFNLIRRRLGLVDEIDFAKDVQEMIVATYEHHYTEMAKITSPQNSQ